MKSIPIIFALLTSACAYDPGGDVRERAKAIATEPAGQITGFCASACTMQMARDCVKPGAVLVFHGPQSTEPWADGAYQAWVNAIANYYPAELAAWYRAEGHNGTHTKSGAEVIAMGARPCGKETK